MRLRDLSEVEGYDAVFVSPHVGDAPLACAARLLGAGGGRRLLVVVCGEPAEAVPGTGWPAALERFKVDLLALRVPPAEERDARYASLRGLAQGRGPGDDAAASELAQRLDELRRLARARDVYLPLGVGGHADHRLALEAGLRVFTPGEGRNVFLYEERPAGLLPGLVRLRLAQLGAWLPPGTAALDSPGLARLLVHAQRDAPLGCAACPPKERLRLLPMLARQWRETRAWRPQRALGLRLQPVVAAGDDGAHAAAGEALLEWARQRPAGASPAERVERLAATYARRLGGSGHVERYWLLLPERAGAA